MFPRSMLSGSTFILTGVRVDAQDRSSMEFPGAPRTVASDPSVRVAMPFAPFVAAKPDTDGEKLT